MSTGSASASTRRPHAGDEEGEGVVTNTRDSAILAHTKLHALSLQVTPPLLRSSSSDAAAASAPSRSALTQLQQRIDHQLPSTTWYQSSLAFDTDQYRVASFSLQHGSSLAPLSVRVLHDHCCIGAATNSSERDRAGELDAALQWLVESVVTGSAYPVIGLDCESDCKVTSEGEVRLVQIATMSRCLLLRIPDQYAIQQYISAHANGRANTALFTPFFHQLMQNRSVFKSGAELWTDALDLWSCCPGVEVNACLNMSWILRNQHGGALSLAAMVNHSLRTENAFLKDKAMTCSDWGAPHLSLRQMVYAALDAQTSCVCGANQPQIPRPIAVSDLPRTLVIRAAEWKAVTRAHKLEIDAVRDVIGGVRLQSNLQADLFIVDAAQAFIGRAMQGEEPFHPFATELLGTAFPTAAQVAQSMPPPNADSLFATGELTLDPSNASWWFHAAVEPNFDFSYSDTEWWTRLDATQRAALDACDKSRITAIVGGPGTGTTTIAAAEVVRSLTRSTSIILDQVSTAVRAAANKQRVLCVAPSDAAARVLAAALAELLPPQRMILFVSPEFADEWHPDQFAYLRVNGYVHGMQDGTGEGVAISDTDRDVLVCSADFALTTQFPSRLYHRQTVVIDEANQLWLLKALLVLRKLPHTERLILLGDERQLGAHFGRREVESVLAAAQTAATQPGAAINLLDTAPKTSIPTPFRAPAFHTLKKQYRMRPHLAQMVSELFYDESLQVGGSDRSRVVGWVDVQGQPTRHPADPMLGWINQVEINAVVHLWNCVSIGTDISLSNGTSVKVEQLHGTESLLAYGADRGIVARHATQLIDNGKRRVIELLFLDGRRLVVTPDHRILRSDGEWIEARELRSLEEKNFDLSKESVTMGVRPPLDEPREDAQRCDNWSLQLNHLQVTFDMKEHRAHTLAFFRVLGRLMTDGTVGEDRVCSLVMEHELDVASIQRDISLISGAHAHQSFDGSRWILRLSRPLSQEMIALDLLVGELGQVITKLPPVITADDKPACPLPVVRAFLSGLFGGGGETLSLVHKKHGHFKPIAFTSSLTGDVAHVEGPRIQKELGPLLARCGFDAKDLTWTWRSGATPIAAAGHADQKMMLTGTLRIDVERTSLFAQKIGFAHCAHKQVCLEAGLAVLNARHHLLGQRRAIRAEFDRITRQCGFGTFASRFSRAVEAVDRVTPLHPTVRAWKPTRRNRMERDTVSLDSHGASVQTLLALFNADHFFSEKNSPSDSTSVAPRSTTGMPTFRVPLLSKREILEPRQVFDITVPVVPNKPMRRDDFHALQAAEASFLANGVVVHNCYAMRPGFTLEHIAIVCMFEAQRREIIDQQPAMHARCFTVEEFMGQQAAVVLLTLAAARITPSLEEVRRVNVACSRASAKLYLIGDRAALMASSNDTVWHEIDEYEYCDLEDIFPELALDVASNFPVLKAAQPANAAPASTAAALDADAALNSQWGKGKLPVTAPPSRPVAAAPVSAQPKPVPASVTATSSLDNRLIHSLTAVLLHHGGVAMSDLSRAFLLFHGTEWSAYSDVAIDEFVERHAGDDDERAAFRITINVSDEQDPIVRAAEDARQVEGEVSSSPPPVRHAVVANAPAPAPAPAVPQQAAVLAAAVAAIEDEAARKRLQQKRDRLAQEKADAAAAAAERAAMEKRQVEEKARQAKAAAREAERMERVAKASTAAVAAKEVQKGPSHDPKLKVAAMAIAAAAAVTQSSEEAAADDASYQSVSKRHAYRHPTNLAAALAAEIAPPTAADVNRCNFCKATVPNDADTCPTCHNDIGREVVGSPKEEEKETKETSAGQKIKKAELPAATTANEVSSSSSSSSSAATVAAATAIKTAATTASANTKTSASVTAVKVPAPSAAVSTAPKAAVATAVTIPPSAAAVAAAAATAAPTPSAGDAPAASVYPIDMSPSLYLSPGELDDLSKNARKKLMWLCSDCCAPNALSLTACELCATKRPNAATVRFAPQVEIASLPKSFWSDDICGEVSYESLWAKVAYSSQRGYHLVAKMRVPAGTVLLHDQVIIGDDHLCSNGLEKKYRVPPPVHVTYMAKMIAADPVLSASLARAHPPTDPEPPEFAKADLLKQALQAPPSVKTNAQLWKQLLTMVKRPKDVSLHAWQLATHTALHANLFHIDHPKHQRCPCQYGHYATVRQSALLEPSCWPNCASVRGVKGVPSSWRAIVAICDIEAGSVLTDVSPRDGLWEWMMLPRENRTSDLDPESDGFPRCRCPRCMGHVDVESGTGAKVGADADAVLHAILPGHEEEIDMEFVEEEYEAVETQFEDALQALDDLNAVESDEDDDDHESASSTASSSPHARSSQVKAAATRQFNSVASETWSRAFLFLTQHPLHRSHWYIQSIRGQLLKFLAETQLWTNSDLWLDCPSDASAEETAEKEIAAEEGYRQMMTQILHVLDDAIRANKAFFKTMDPCKSQAFELLSQFHRHLQSSGFTLHPASDSLGLDQSDPTDEDEDDFQIPTIAFTGIGTREGQNAYIEQLMRRVDPAGEKLKEMGYPKRDRFGEKVLSM